MRRADHELGLLCFLSRNERPAMCEVVVSGSRLDSNQGPTDYELKDGISVGLGPSG
jgi:hypothetical protein